jgi:protein-tyrosine phosphatase
MKRIIIILASVLPLVSNAQLADSAKRLVRMEGAVNFRDIGGYKTVDGKEVKWGRVFRSADVSKLTDRDLATLEEKRIHTVVDFRGVKESAKAPDHLLPNTDYILCPAGSDSLPNAKDIAKRMQQDSFLEKFYTNTEHFANRYKPFFQKLIALPEGESIMYHCTGGRDRTGMATALFLYLLGVPQETIEADFVASNVYLAPRNKEMFKDMADATGKDVEALKKAMALRPELIRAMFNSIQSQYGSVEAFFETRLGVGKEEIKLLRNKYTI